ncbi:hypothetical protein [Flaviaesturariibacter terrae]
MSLRLRNRYNMQMAVKSCMQKFRSKWEGNEHIAESMNYIEPRLQRAQGLFDARESTYTEGHTDAKNALLDSISARAALMSKRLTVFARKRGLRVLLVEVDHPKRYYENGPELERISRCAAITERAEHYLPQLEPYKIRLADVAALNADIEELRPLSSQRDALGDEKQTITQSLPRLLQEIQEKLYELDDEISAFMDDDPDFQETYFNARKITDRKATRSEQE